MQPAANRSFFLLFTAAALAAILWALPAGAQTITIAIGYVTREEEAPIPTSLLDPVVEDAGVQGARLAIADNTRNEQIGIVERRAESVRQRITQFAAFVN